MGGPRLSKEEIERRVRYNKRYSVLLLNRKFSFNRKNKYKICIVGD
jgi:hypothetical protein